MVFLSRSVCALFKRCALRQNGQQPFQGRFCGSVMRASVFLCMYFSSSFFNCSERISEARSSCFVVMLELGEKRTLIPASKASELCWFGHHGK